MLYIQRVRERCAFYKQLFRNLSRQAAKQTQNCNIKRWKEFLVALSLGGEKIFSRVVWYYLFKSWRDWDLMTFYQWDLSLSFLSPCPPLGDFQ